MVGTVLATCVGSEDGDCLVPLVGVVRTTDCREDIEGRPNKMSIGSTRNVNLEIEHNVPD